MKVFDATTSREAVMLAATRAVPTGSFLQPLDVPTARLGGSDHALKCLGTAPQGRLRANWPEHTEPVCGRLSPGQVKLLASAAGDRRSRQSTWARSSSVMRTTDALHASRAPIFARAVAAPAPTGGPPPRVGVRTDAQPGWRHPLGPSHLPRAAFLPQPSRWRTSVVPHTRWPEDHRVRPG